MGLCEIWPNLMCYYKFELILHKFSWKFHTVWVILQDLDEFLVIP